MKVGFFSPLPPASTGVADYSAALLPLLREFATVDVSPEKCDVALYHVGNNGLHREIYQRAIARPGIVVLHDAVLQHLLLGTLDEDQYVEEFAYNYGEASRAQGRQLWQQRARSGADARYFAHPMLKRIAAASSAIIVHNPAAAALVHKHTPHTPVVEIPHLFEAPDLPSAEDTRLFRESLGIGEQTLLIGTFGHQRETRRLSVLLRAFERAGRIDAGLGRFRIADAGERRGAAARSSPRSSHGLSAGSRTLAICCRRRPLHQPALSLRGRNLRHRDSHDGNRQTCDLHRRRGVGPDPGECLPACICRVG